MERKFDMMKEKTFEELMHEYTVNMDGVTTYYLQPKTVLALLRQVREATIAECTDILLNRDYSWSGQIELEYKKLPTDRILTDK